MRLISCHIENYGRLSGLDISFDSGITELLWENGEGKTTLASFIKAMLYGLDTYTSKTRDFVDRRRYYPFNEGAFGGTLTFEKGGAEYVIVRRFGRKSATEDSVSVYCNGSETDALGECIGKALFGLDEESFERTLFVTSGDMELCGTGGINGKLNQYGDADAESAVKRLNTAANKYSRGKNSRISESESRRAELIKSIEELKALDNDLDRLYSERRELIDGMRRLEERETAARAFGILLEKWKVYDGMMNDIAEDEKRISAVRERYPKGMPELDIVRKAQQLRESIGKKEALVQASIFDPEKEKEISELEALFEGGEPSDAELDGVRAEIKSVYELEQRIRLLKDQSKSKDISDIEGFFGGRVPDEAQMSRLEELKEQLEEKRERLIDSARSADAEPTGNGKRTLLPFAILALVGAIALICGIILFGTLGAVIAVVGAICLLIGLFGYFNGRVKAVENQRATLGVGLQTELRETENALKNALSLCGRTNVEEPIRELEELKQKRQRYIELTSEESERNSEIDKCKEYAENSNRYISSFLEVYGLSAADPSEQLELLVRKRDKRRELLRERDDASRKRAELALELEGERAQLAELLERYLNAPVADEAATIQDIETDIKEVESLEERRRRLCERAEKYKREESLHERPEAEGEDILVVSDEISSRREKINAVEREIADGERRLYSLDMLEAEREELELRIENEKTTDRLLKSAARLIGVADTSLKEKYIYPIKERFERYAQAIERAFGDRIELDKDYRVSFHQNGAIRDDRHLSAGQRSVWALCLRLAFIDELFGEEQTFLILDDPFSSLDKGNMSNVAALLSELKRDTQIVYLTCHDSRSLLSGDRRL